MNERICSVEECERSAYCRALCKNHYQQQWVSPRGCDVPGCSRPHASRGYCATHYARLRNWGEVRPDLPITDGTSSDILYGSAHDRVRSVRGSASSFECVDCGQPAREWSYNLSGVAERVGQHGASRVRYSTDPAQYVPRCVPCHRRHDRQAVA